MKSNKKKSLGGKDLRGDNSRRIANRLKSLFWLGDGEQPRVKATRAQALRIAATFRKESIKSKKGFKDSTGVFLAGLILIGFLGVYASVKIVSGSTRNTLIFIALSLIVFSCIVLLLHRDLDTRFNKLTDTIHSKGLSE